jgi:hypothetical protein
MWFTDHRLPFHVFKIYVTAATVLTNKSRLNKQLEILLQTQHNVDSAESLVHNIASRRTYSVITQFHVLILLRVWSNLMMVDPCIIIQFIKKNPTNRNNVSKFYYSIFVWSSTCFGRHTAHHQEPKTVLEAFDFSHVKGCWTCMLCLTTSNNLPRVKNQRLPVSFRLLMMDGMSTETCWVSYKYGIIKC